MLVFAVLYSTIEDNHTEIRLYTSKTTALKKACLVILKEMSSFGNDDPESIYYEKYYLPMIDSMNKSSYSEVLNYYNSYLNEFDYEQISKMLIINIVEETLNEDIEDMTQSIIDNKSNNVSICSKCNGTGILDFGFYTRDCECMNK